MSQINDLHSRRATSEDHDAILNIRHNIYDGRDYIPEQLEHILKSHHCFVFTVEDKIAAFIAFLVIDEGNTMIPRGARLRKEFEGQRKLPEVIKNTDRTMMAQHGIRWKSVTRAGQFAFPERLLKSNQRIIFHRTMARFKSPLAILKNHMPGINELYSRSCDITEGKTILKELIQSSEKKTLFPDEQIEYNSVPFRPTISNLDTVLDDYSLILFSRNASNQAIVTLGTCYRCPAGVMCYVSVYGDESSSNLPGHLARHLSECTKLDFDIRGADSVTCHFVVTMGKKGETNTDNVKKCLHQFEFVQQSSNELGLCCIEEHISESKL